MKTKVVSASHTTQSQQQRWENETWLQRRGNLRTQNTKINSLVNYIVNEFSVFAHSILPLFRYISASTIWLFVSLNVLLYGL